MTVSDPSNVNGRDTQTLIWGSGSTSNLSLTNKFPERIWFGEIKAWCLAQLAFVMPRHPKTHSGTSAGAGPYLPKALSRIVFIGFPTTGSRNPALLPRQFRPSKQSGVVAVIVYNSTFQAFRD